MQNNTNFEFSDQDMIPNAHDAYAYRMENSEAEGKIAFCFPGEEVSFPRVSNFSLREGYADGVAQRGYRQNRFGGDRAAFDGWGKDIRWFLRLNQKRLVNSGSYFWQWVP